MRATIPLRALTALPALLWLLQGLPARADSTCVANTEPGLERARCLFEKTDISTTRRTEQLCAALLMVSDPPIQGDRACLRSQILSELGRFSEAARFAKECDDPALNPSKLARDASERAARYARVAVTFPAKAALKIFATNLKDQTRVLYCSMANEEETQVEMRSNAPDADQVELTLPVGTWRLWIEWNDRSPTWSTELEFTTQSSQRHFEFSVITLSVETAAQATVTVQSEAFSQIAIDQTPPSETRARRMFSATVPSPAKYEITVEAVNHRTQREQVAVSAPREVELRSPIKLAAEPVVVVGPGTTKPPDTRRDLSGGLRPPSESPLWLGSRRPEWLWISAAGVVVAGAAAIPWLIADGQVRDVRTECSLPGSCQDFDDRRSAISTLDTLTNVLLSVGGAAILGGLVGAYWPSTSQHEHAWLIPTCAANGCSVTQRWQF